MSKSNQSVWTIDSASTTIEFAVKYLGFFTVRGSLRDTAGTLRLEPGDTGRAAVEAVIKTAGIATGVKRRDTHLRSPDFLASDRYPEIRFRSTAVQRGTDRDTLRITGLLTIRETTGDVVLDVNEVDQSRSPNGEEVVYYNATTEIDRFKFGISHQRWLIGRRLRIAINLQATRRIELSADCADYPD